MGRARDRATKPRDYMLQVPARTATAKKNIYCRVNLSIGTRDTKKKKNKINKRTRFYLLRYVNHTWMQGGNL